MTSCWISLFSAIRLLKLIMMNPFLSHHFSLPLVLWSTKRSFTLRIRSVERSESATTTRFPAAASSDKVLAVVRVAEHTLPFWKQTVYWAWHYLVSKLRHPVFITIPFERQKGTRAMLIFYQKS